MYCPKCGTQVPDGAVNCPNCGETVQGMTVRPQNRKNWKKIMGGAVIVCAVLVIIGLLIGPSDQSAESPQTADVPSTTDNQQTDAGTLVDASADEPASQALEMYRAIAENSEMPFTISDQAADFIVAHPEFFPGSDSNQGAMTDFVDYELTYPMLAKNAKKYGDCLYDVSGIVVDIDEADDGSVSRLQVADYEGRQYILFYLGTLDEVYEEDEVSGYALPLDVVTFENMSGSYTEAIAMAICHVVKWEETYY